MRPQQRPAKLLVIAEVHARRYLFRPQPDLAQQLQPAAAQALATPDSLKIGIHLRLGDAEMEGASVCRASYFKREKTTSIVTDKPWASQH